MATAQECEEIENINIDEIRTFKGPEEAKANVPTDENDDQTDVLRQNFNDEPESDEEINDDEMLEEDVNTEELDDEPTNEPIDEPTADSNDENLTAHLFSPRTQQLYKTTNMGFVD